MDKDLDFLLASGYQKLDVEVAVGGYEEIPQLDPDLMFVRFIMCHEGMNNNGDTFTKLVLKQAEGTPKYKPIDWEHGQPIVGHITESVYKEDLQGLGYIEATGLIWKFIYPELSSQIKAKASTGDLRLSMECYYKNANYRVGDQIFDQDQAEKLGIVPYVGREYMGKKVARVFNEVIFGGVGVVANPADKNAVFLSVAKDLSALGITDLNDIENISKVVADAVKRSMNDFNQKQHSKESNDALAIAKFVKAFDRAKSSVVGKFNSKTLRTKEQIVAEVRDSVNTLLQEVSSISSAYHMGTASEEVKSELFNLVQEYFEKNIALNNDVSEAYLKEVEEDYITYDIIDYSNDSISTLKASFVVSDSVVEIDFANATETETKEEAQEMKKVATEEEVILANRDQDMREDLDDGGVDEDTEKKKANKKDDQEDLNDGGKDEETEKAGVTLTDDIKENNQDKDKVSTVASEYESKIASLESKLAEANQKVSQLESRFAEIEADKIVASRMSELQGAGIVFSESRLAKEQAKLRVMTNEAYADYKELLFEVAGKSEADKGTDEYKKKVLQADDEVDATLVDDIDDNDDEEDKVSSVASDEYEVEGVSSAKLNIETPLASNNRPFGHLSR